MLTLRMLQAIAIGMVIFWRTADRKKVVETPTKQPGWWATYKRDLRRYVLLRPNESLLNIFLTEQALWALFQFRLASGIYKSNLPWQIKRPLLLVMGLWQKTIEMTTGFCLPYRTKIGPGLYLSHFGTTSVNPDTVIGENCTLSSGVSIAISGRGTKRGVPVLGDRVHVAAHAVLLGKITIGDDVMIGPNSTVNSDVPPHTTVMGVPAVHVNNYGSVGYIVLEPGMSPGNMLVRPEDSLNLN